MPEWLTKMLGGGLGSMFKDIVGSFKADPTEVLKFQELIEQNKAVLQQKELELASKAMEAEQQLNATAGQNIRAEAESGDKFVRRARPSVIWMGNLLLFWNYALIPVFGAHWHLSPVTIPEAFYWTWGTVVTGYVFMRGAEKTVGATVGGQGGSVQLPFGLGKLDSKGD